MSHLNAKESCWCDRKSGKLLRNRLQGKLSPKRTELSVVSLRFHNHNIKPFNFCCSKQATPARQNKFWPGEEMIQGNAFFVVIDVLIKPVLSALQRPCVEIQTIHHYKTLKAIVYYLSILKQFSMLLKLFLSFPCLALFSECLVWDLPFNFPQGNKSRRVEFSQNSCNCELRAPTWNFKLKGWNEANVPVTFYEA